MFRGRKALDGFFNLGLRPRLERFICGTGRERLRRRDASSSRERTPTSLKSGACYEFAKAAKELGQERGGVWDVTELLREERGRRGMLWLLLLLALVLRKGPRGLVLVRWSARERSVESIEGKRTGETDVEDCGRAETGARSPGTTGWRCASSKGVDEVERAGPDPLRTFCPLASCASSWGRRPRRTRHCGRLRLSRPPRARCLPTRRGP